MKIQRISAAMSVAKANQISQTQQAQVSKNATNPIESNSSKASQIIRNYFMGSQMVNPAFTGFPCTTSNFKVKELEDMPCTCCGRPMMTNKQTDEFALKAGRASGAELNNILEQNMPYFRAEEKAIVHYIQKQLKNMPDASLTTAISRTNADPAQILRDEQVDVLKRTSEKSKELLGDKNIVQNLCDRELAKTFGVDVQGRRRPKTGVGSRFNRTEFLSQIVDAENKGVAHKDIHKILDVAVQLPESEKIISKMLSDYGRGSSDVRFAKRLIQKAVVTAEHIHPKSKGGPNATNNYMGECQECNGSRGNMSYDEWMKRYPNMPDNIQVNADAVTEEIIKGKIGGNYDDYPVDLKEAIEKETNGKVILTVKNPEEIDKAREERGLPKPTADLKEKNNAASGYQGSYKGNPELDAAMGTKRGQKSEKSEKSEKTDSTDRPAKTGKSGKSKKKGKKHIMRDFSELAQAQQQAQDAKEVA